jgi:LuxR family maltose regulon positive regulatory protein
MRQILATKLHAPLPTGLLVVRPRLIAHLDDALRRPLTAVIAPPGFGKTTLVSGWAARVHTRGQASVAWLTLDQHDDDPARFWNAVIAALQTIDPILGCEVLPFLSTITISSLEHLLTPLVNQLAERSAAPIVLVLDDYHEISALAIHAGLAFLIDHFPPHIHLIVTSRSDPPLPLARLRARSQLSELRVADLRFTGQEAADFLNDVMGLELAPETITALEHRTEGWVAGLQLAALSMQHHTDRAEFVRTLSGSHHYILDYLAEEVLHRQPAHIRDFLLYTSILDRFCAPLCDAVTGGTDAAAALATVERVNLFLTPLDDERRWYRYHTLFAEMLRARLSQEHGAIISELHRRASAWFSEHAAGDTTMLGEAIQHALAAGDDHDAAQLVDASAETLWVRNDLLTLRSWLLALPTSVLHGHPRLALMLAQILVFNASFADVPPLLDAAAAALESAALPADEERALRGGIAAVRVHTLRLADRYDEALIQARQALELLPASEGIGRALAAFGLAITQHMQGNLPVAEASYRTAIGLGEVVGDRSTEITTRCMHGRILLDRGNLLGAEVAFQQALTHATIGSQRMPIAGWALIGLGSIAHARHSLPTTADWLMQGLDLARSGGIRNAIYLGSGALVRLRLAEGDLADAHAVAAQLVQETRISRIGNFMRWADALQALVELRSNNLSAAIRWARIAQPRADMLMFTDKAAFTVFVRVLLATGQAEAALRCTRAQRALIAPFDHIKTQIELYLLDATALLAKGELDAARVALDSALAMAAPRGLVQLFVEAGAPIATLLAQRQGSGPLGTFAAQLLEIVDRNAAMPDLPFVVETDAGAHPRGQFQYLEHLPALAAVVDDTTLVEALSERELEVLALMAVGRSNQEIADRLIISVPTVKKHGSNIFGKLQATNRTEAVARARELGLLH